MAISETKKETEETVRAVIVRECSPGGERSETTGGRIVKQVSFNREWKREGVMDEQSAESKEE